jgi:hypothetical protein
MQIGTELYVVVGQFGTVLTEPGPDDKAFSAKTILDAEKYGPHMVKPVAEVAGNRVHATLPQNMLTPFRR